MTEGQRRIRLTLHYDGADFHGWQVQPEVRTVQGEVEATLERITGDHHTVLASGRTDAGVHATGQVAAVLLPSRWSPDELLGALNALLPDDVWVESAVVEDPDFHPRYDAVGRTYEYRLGTSPRSSSPFHARWCWPLDRRIVDAGALDRCAALLPGRHSFAAFAKAGQPRRGEHCTVRVARWEGWGELGRRFRITADRYLHHMVRYLVGTMVEAATGLRDEEEFGRLLDGDPELVTSPPAPPEGLFLVHVAYPGEPGTPDGVARRAGAGAGGEASS